MASTTNRELNNEIASLKNFIPDVKSKDFTPKRTQAIKSIFKNHSLIDKINKFDFTDSKMEKFPHEYHHWGANKRIMDIINK